MNTTITDVRFDVPSEISCFLDLDKNCNHIVSLTGFMKLKKVADYIYPIGVLGNNIELLFSKENKIKIGLTAFHKEGQKYYLISSIFLNGCKMYHRLVNPDDTMVLL